jgi:membrane-bound lytic murein transglycosylase B
MQFMPTTYRDYAVDFDGDGRRDLWHSMPDIFASAANYLASLGWNGEMTWGREVALPIGFEYALSGPEKAIPLAEWQQLGVRATDGGDLPAVETKAALILPGGAFSGPAFLVYSNFRAIMTWNNSMNYAIAVGHLADRIGGGSPLLSMRVEGETPLSRDQIIEMQGLLEQLGFDTGGIDGRVGAKTRDAVRIAQQRAQLPADGYPTMGLLDFLRSAIRSG